ncbi:hypothetical protein, partial [Escherichia coli]|uniref:hypothetical protein n=1 Tax=Escherichia coli TaxID=562 RepID=UPI003F7FE15C
VLNMPKQQRPSFFWEQVIPSQRRSAALKITEPTDIVSAAMPARCRPIFFEWLQVVYGRFMVVYQSHAHCVTQHPLYHIAL